MEILRVCHPATGPRPFRHGAAPAGADPAAECAACLGTGWAWAAEYDPDGGVDAATREPCTCPRGRGVVR